MPPLINWTSQGMLQGTGLELLLYCQNGPWHRCSEGTSPVPTVPGHDLGAHQAGTAPSWWSPQRHLDSESRKIYSPGWRLHGANWPQGYSLDTFNLLIQTKSKIWKDKDTSRVWVSPPRIWITSEGVCLSPCTGRLRCYLPRQLPQL